MGRAIMIVLIFIAAGPLIGLVTLSIVLSGFAAANVDVKEAGDAAAFGAFVLIYGVLFAHFMGAAWAAVAGAIVALRASLWGPGSMLEGVPIGALTALASLVSWDLKELNGSNLGEIEAPVLAGWMLVHIVPTIACISLTRGWQNQNSATS